MQILNEINELSPNSINKAIRALPSVAIPNLTHTKVNCASNQLSRNKSKLRYIVTIY